MTILATTDLSDNSKAAIRSAARIASHRDAALRVLFCDEHSAEDAAWRLFVQTPWEEPEEREREAREQLDSFLEETLGDLSTRPETETDVRLEHLEDAIADMTGEGSDIDLLVVGATGASGLTRVLLGSSAEDVVRTADPPVLVVPHDHELDRVSDILAPVDLSDCSKRSLQVAVDLARDYRAKLHVLRALPMPTAAVVPFESDVPPVDLDVYEEDAREALDHFLSDVDTSNIEVTTSVPIDTPHTAIADASEEIDADLVVMGTHGRRGFERFFLGSTTVKVLRQIARPVMTVRHSES